MKARAVLLASTILYREAFEKTPYTEHAFSRESVMSADELTEFAARSVHGTWQHVDSHSNREYVRTLLNIDDTSYMEHASATFYVTGVSVSLADTLSAFPGLRTTQASFTYADPEKVGLVLPEDVQADDELSADVETFFEDAMTLYADIVRSLARRGLLRHASADAASAVLPNCAETALVVTGSLATYRAALDGWLTLTYGDEVNAVARQFLEALQRIAPNVFQDFPRPTLTLVQNDNTVTSVAVSQYGEASRVS